MLWNSSNLSGSEGLDRKPGPGSVSGSTAGVVPPVLDGNSADRPLPSAFRWFRSGSLIMGQDFLCKLNVGLCAAGSRIIGQNWFAEAGSFREPDTPWNHA